MSETRRRCSIAIAHMCGLRGVQRAAVAGIESVLGMSHGGLVLSPLSTLEEEDDANKQGDRTHD